MTNMKADRTDESASADEPRRGRGRPQLRSDEETRALILEALPLPEELAPESW